MKIDILTLFPEMFAGPFSSSILKRAQERGLVEIGLINIRDFSTNKHHTVDDAPYGGGAGMVMGPEALFGAVEHVARKYGSKPGRVVLMCPQGIPFTQAYAADLAREETIVLVCGHYEGIDERVREALVTDEISIGDYVLTGGELPAMVVVDAVARLVPGVLGEALSVMEESFSNGLLEYPHFTRPREFRGLKVPEVLLSGHHEEIRKWRRRQSLLRTLERRPEMLKQAGLTREDREILKELLASLNELDLS
ncbi:MAG: tRNA (guanosine(37)-N1)-methyltransferase TrmD [Pelotomaculum sp.]|uniref:tRNA (guanine-N(1)-)-methyltransferase n=1 Tax=Pelotomaculum thermopropionicum (strain DSM 13744 / JCM 10971 / SI) TaxID=370438 RepID=TRMD_PELTS|nr:RecName: Full=tRNA (guanine-N(1)-)-methyltransferase; AltName: Full=M1G-methyltransferase; AltName: Full=tRNA [GM37] methyltransferase [Pelotomaculum thermopropionicum SI]NPV73255.1 tRNA (guanosine(37)-N1)-methyltransferase TrmD [Pelotomaculum sp.]BAF59900.1 tRNA-(guanine-N1)-methyltransferase [Pelotomaculum thermopropionicum SI]